MLRLLNENRSKSWILAGPDDHRSKIDHEDDVKTQTIGIDLDNGIDDRDSGGVDGDGYKSVRASHDTSFFDGVSHLLVTADRKTSSQIKSRDNHDTSFFDGVSHLLVTADRKTSSYTKNQTRKATAAATSAHIVYLSHPSLLV